MVGSSRSASSLACRRKVPARSRWRPSKRTMTSSSGRVHVVVGQGKDALEHHARSGLLKLEALLAGHEELRDHPRRVRPPSVEGCG